MDKKEAKELQEEIKTLLEELGWNYRVFSEKIADRLYQQGKLDEECEATKIYENLKKQLSSRIPKRIHKLNDYLTIIKNSHEYKRLNRVDFPHLRIEKLSDKEKQIIDLVKKVSSNFFNDKNHLI